MRPSSAPRPPSAIAPVGPAAALSMTPKAGPGLFKRAVACVLMVTINLSSMGQAVAQIIRGPNGAPLTGYTANGTYVQGGVVVGNPHQRLHDLTNPTLWTTGAVSFSNSTDPDFAQPTIDQMMSALAPPVDPGGLYLGRLYINPTNPYTAGVGVLSAPPSPTPETGATPPTGPLIDNHEHYARALAHAQANLGDRHADITRWSTTDPALGNGTAYLAKTHVDSSAELRNLHFDAAPGKPVFQATQTTTAGAVGYYAIQGEQAKTHLANIQQQNAALIGTSIFFSQQRLQMPSSTQASTDWEGNVHDPMAGFEASLGSAAQTPWGDPSFTVGYIRPDGQAHEFKLNDRHFQGFASQQGNGEWGASAEDLNRTLGQELGKAAVQHQAGQQAAANIDFGVFKEDRALFMQGMNLYQHVGKNDWYLLDGLKSGQITQGSADYERARELAQQAFRTAYAYHTEYQTQLKHTKESAAYQAKTADLGRYSDQELFEQGLRLYDKRASERQEQLLRDLQAGRLTPGTPDYVEARALAEARYRVALQKALEPPKKPSFFKQLAGVFIAAVAIYFGQTQIATWAMNIGTAVGATSAFAVQAIGTTISATISSSISTTIATGSVSKGLQAGLKAGATSLLTGGLQTLTGGGFIGETLARSISQTVVYGGDFGENLLGNAINAGVDIISKDVAAQIKGAELSQMGKELAHAGLGCAAGTFRAQDTAGCVPGAVGAVVAHAGATWADPAMGRTLSDDDVAFWSGLAGGTAAALAGNHNDVQTNFEIGQSTGKNAVKNNYLTERQQLARADEINACDSVACKVGVDLKYKVISGQQDVGLVVGFGGGVGKQGVDSTLAMVEMVKNWDESYAALKAIINDPEFRAQVGDSIFKEYQNRLETLNQAYNDGGWDGSVTAGVEAGRLAFDIVGAGTGALGASRLLATASKAGGQAIMGALGQTSTQAANGLAKFDRLVASGGLFAADGKPLMDFSKLSSAQKAVIGDTLGSSKIEALIPGAEKIGRSPSVGQTGVDDLFKVNKPGVDYVVVEYKYGTSTLKNTADGLQMSDTWLTGAYTNYNRILESVGNPKTALEVRDALRNNRVEKWLVHTDPYGNVTVGVLDKAGKLIPNPEAISKILGGSK